MECNHEPFSFPGSARFQHGGGFFYIKTIGGNDNAELFYRPDLGKDPDRHALTMEQFTNLIEVLKLSKHMNSPISQRGKGSMTHGKGKRKRK